MSERAVKYYTGKFHSQFSASHSSDSGALKTQSLELEPRFIFIAENEITLEEYENAKSSRVSSSTHSFQGRLHNTYFFQKENLQPHCIIQENTWIEVTYPGGTEKRELASEIYAELDVYEFEKGDSAFVAMKDGIAHGRANGIAFCRIPEWSDDELKEADQKERLKGLNRRKGCASNFVPQRLLSRSGGGISNRGCLPGIGARGCVPGIGGGCGRTGCGLSSLFGLLLLILSLWRGCSHWSDHDSQRVIHDTVYVDEKSKQDIIKQFLDTTTITKTDAIELPNVQFYTNSAKLLPYSINSIQQLADYMQSHPGIHATIEGHTDNVGETQNNLTLSQDRAETVRQVLISFGVEPSRIDAHGYGKSRPRATNDTMEGRALNRRVEVRLSNTIEKETQSTEVTDNE
jgi:outer membrane protein OmpA-like peptidoglycan-associated protein